nr:uncharacterized protein LOC127328856 [Lolium perenne]
MLSHTKNLLRTIHTYIFHILGHRHHEYLVLLLFSAYSQVINFVKLASFANAFPKTNFGQFVQNNPQDLRQQTTIFDCRVFVMMFMTQWDGKIIKPFNQDLIQLRMLISYKILTSSLNKVDPTWVLKKK